MVTPFAYTAGFRTSRSSEITGAIIGLFLLSIDSLQWKWRLINEQSERQRELINCVVGDVTDNWTVYTA